MMNAMDDCVLTKGRYRNKTYKEVYENDPDFCESIREAAENNESHPADQGFAEYLIMKSVEANRICEQTVGHFLEAFTSGMKKEFGNLVNNIKLGETFVHPPCALDRSNGFLGVFIRFFFKKCVFNIHNEDGYYPFPEKYASIFPFEVNDDRTNLQIPISEFLYNDDEFKLRTDNFLKAHFDNVQFDEIVGTFLSNIYRFKSESNMDLNQLERFLNNERSRCIDGSGNGLRSSCPSKSYPHPYLKAFPRLNRNGAIRYIKMYNCYEEVVKSLSGELAPSSKRYNTSYFLNLPETNFYELFSLLEPRFFQDNFDEYSNCFHKYLFFFVRALESTSKPIFFIDDYLFECLKSLQKLKKSRLTPDQLIYELSMLTLVNRRRQRCDPIVNLLNQIDAAHLEYVRRYVEDFKGIETARVQYSIPDPDLLLCRVTLCSEDTAVDVRFSKNNYGSSQSTWKLFIMAALCEDPIIKRLVLYNGFKGKEYSVNLDESFDRDGIKAFVRKYNNWDFSIEAPPEKSFTRGWEYCFVEGTINWEEKRNAR